VIGDDIQTPPQYALQEKTVTRTIFRADVDAIYSVSKVMKQQFKENVFRDC
jgi:hypothetical protein